MHGQAAKYLLGVGLLALAPAVAQAEQQAFRFHLPHVLGASLDMAVTSADVADALAAYEAARAEISRLELVLSGWREDSELAALNRSTEADVSEDLFQVIALAEGWRAKTGGAFDGRLGALEALWREAAATCASVDATQAAGIARAARSACVGIDPLTRTVSRPEGAVFALDAVAKGYIIDRALEAARAAAPGVEGLMVDIGGDLRCWGEAPAGQGWTVAVADPAALQDNARPAALLRIRDGAVATSGRGMRDRMVDGRAWSHLFSPARGIPAEGIASATVFAASAADADALATAVAAVTPAEGLAMVESVTGAEALVIDDSGARHATSGWTTLARDPPARLIRTAAAAAAGPAWPAGFAVTIDYQLPRPAGSKIYSPYVAIWVTDEDNRLIRVVTMLGNDLDWINQNYIWWRRFGRARPQLIDAVARPTRPAGRYSAVWNGRDDAGAPVAQGRYIVHVEVVREYGLHSYQAMPIALMAAPAQATGMAQDEIGATLVRYGRRP
jgi:thiamine biosynthesis lipoprotein